MSKEIFWVAFGTTKCNSFVLIESLGEIITINDSEDSLVYVEVHSNIQIPPGIVFALIIWEWQLVSLKENSLWNSGVLNLGLKNVDGVIVKEIVDSALSGSEILVGVFNNWFDEKGVKY
jgi:hypothetical protein